MILKLRDELIEAGHQVDTFTFDNIHVRSSRSLLALLFPWWVARHLARHGHLYDVIDASTGDCWLAYALGLPKSALRVTHSHGLETLLAASEISTAQKAGIRLPFKRRLWRYGLRLWEVRRSIRSADLCLVLHQGEVEHLVRKLGVDPGQVRIVQLAADDSSIRSRPAQQSSGGIELVQIGSYTERKGIRTTINAMSRLLAQHPDMKMRFLGTGVEASRVKMDFPLAVRDQIYVVPKFENSQLPSLLSSAQIQLMPSFFEGYGIAKLEAMSNGLVPIVSDDPGTCAGLDHLGNGIVIPIDDAGAMHSAIELLLRDECLRKRLQLAAKVSASALTWQASAAARSTFYREAIKRKLRTS